MYVDIQDTMNRDDRVVLPVAAVLTMLVLALLLRSVVSPWSVMAVGGSRLRGYARRDDAAVPERDRESGLIFLIPLIIDMVVVALGTDDTILRMARLREEATNGRSPREATRFRRRWGSRCRSGSWWPRS